MMPKAVQDAGYTAVGLGVLALQQVQTQQRMLARRTSSVVNAIKIVPRAISRAIASVKP